MSDYRRIRGDCEQFYIVLAQAENHKFLDKCRAVCQHGFRMLSLHKKYSEFCELNAHYQLGAPSSRDLSGNVPTPTNLVRSAHAYNAEMEYDFSGVVLTLNVNGGFWEKFRAIRAFGIESGWISTFLMVWRDEAPEKIMLNFTDRLDPVSPAIALVLPAITLSETDLDTINRFESILQNENLSFPDACTQLGFTNPEVVLRIFGLPGNNIPSTVDDFFRLNERTSRREVHMQTIDKALMLATIALAKRTPGTFMTMRGGGDRITVSLQASGALNPERIWRQNQLIGVVISPSEEFDGLTQNPQLAGRDGYRMFRNDDGNQYHVFQSPPPSDT
ncbi:MAG: hypothetical protein LBC42_02040 [Puniceicoccales bacterium]|jgi:hypothetical protein|nr:hypothetical protein [Puniceicoccales bacterium]